VRLDRDGVWDEWWRWDEGREEMIDREGRSWKVRGKKRREGKSKPDGVEEEERRRRK